MVITMQQNEPIPHEVSVEHQKLIDRLKNQLLIVFLKRLGGEARIPLSEVDDTGQDLLAFKVDENGLFTFTLVKKT
jgi:hypothetical protein